MRKISILIFAAILFSSCGKALKNDVSDCSCDDIWNMVEDKELLEIIEVWGQPEDRGGSTLNEEFYATWYKKLNTNCSGDDKCDKIQINVENNSGEWGLKNDGDLYMYNKGELFIYQHKKLD